MEVSIGHSWILHHQECTWWTLMDGGTLSSFEIRNWRSTSWGHQSRPVPSERCMEGRPQPRRNRCKEDQGAKTTKVVRVHKAGSKCLKHLSRLSLIAYDGYIYICIYVHMYMTLLVHMSISSRSLHSREMLCDLQCAASCWRQLMLHDV